MFVALIDATPESSGGKAGTLGRLLRAGLPVPDGIALTTDAYRAAVASSVDAPSLFASTDTRDQFERRLRELGDRPLAVRSSATDEDTATRSAAGQHETFLAVQGIEEVAVAVRACWDSLHTPIAAAYREDSPRVEAAETPAMGVLVHRLVDADASGVMFTPDDPTAVTTIEASWGLGSSIVGGTVTPDAFYVEPDGSLDRTIADKHTRVDRDGQRLVTRDVPTDDRLRPAIGDPTARRLAELGREIAELLGAPQDIEWAVADGRLWILQARPITASPPPSHPGSPLGSGTPGSHGTATGPARIVGGPEDFAQVRHGDVLVCSITTPAWTPLLRMVAAVITETGGVLSHAAIVARELGVPAVLGVPEATRRLKDGVPVTVDGTTGAIVQDR